MKNAHRGLEIASVCTMLMMLTGPLRAATLTLWRAESNGRLETNQAQVRIQGARCRIDVSSEFTILLDTETDSAYQISHRAKTFTVESLQHFAATSPCASTSNIPPPTATGNFKTIQGQIAYEYRIATPCGNQSIWVAPSYTNWQKFREAVKPFGAKVANKVGFHVAFENLAGMVIQTETSGKEDLVTRKSTLISARIVPDDPSLMRIPEDYVHVESLTSRVANTNEAYTIVTTHTRAVGPNTNGMVSLSSQLRSRKDTWETGVPLQTGGISQGTPASAPTGDYPSARVMRVGLSSWGRNGSVIITNPLEFKPPILNSGTLNKAANDGTSQPAIALQSPPIIFTTNSARKSTNLVAAPFLPAAPGQK